MRVFAQMAIAGAIVALLASPALAQRREGRGGFGGRGFGVGQFMLLDQKSVQGDLQLSEEQVKKISELVDKQRESARVTRDSSREDRKKAEEAAKDTEKSLADVLNPDQTKRFKQVKLQVAG